ncbi:(2Fe-2S)-binding protein [Caldisericum exile]|uniref:Dye-linked L-proline dehydrogenase delta subunit n=1 Tax=Caldisericum exile (strain DSM 21853 / NBRC 104410 / AZM16c01) TaxID=511051 RepID=A0A7U6GEZ1_CALEA|nr:(2Fe-2S)-binding protein [Caldisericum exile]BAL81149.1 dye-linked L-proline dehydrogenase delta subunit [Caldisericum exile AZM16c01]
MDKKNIIICRCEDVTYEDIIEAYKEGYRDIESLRRHLKVGTGPCQGKTCIPLLQRILFELNKEFPNNITVRPPETPIPFGIFVKERKDEKL